MKTNIHHIINVKSGKEEVFFDHLGNLSIPSIKDIHRNIDQIVFGIGFENGYFFNQLKIANNRNITKAEYKKRSHTFRKSEYEFDCYCVGQELESSRYTGYEPDLNPGGGPYNPNDNI